MSWLDKFGWGRKLAKATRLFFFKHDTLNSAKLRGDPKTVARIYDFVAPIYDFFFPHVETYSQTVEYIVTNLVTEDDRVLELGAGTGIQTVPMAAKARFVVAADLNSKMLEKGRKKARKHGVSHKISYNLGNACQLPYADQSFSLVFSGFMEVYLTIPEKIQMMREIHRVLAPGGRVVFFSGNGEVSGRYIKRAQWESIFSDTSFGDVDITEHHDVFRVIHARKRERPLLPA
jgi:ubiquinone/menaquinone biosynthesis C-methylase UbiE